MRIRGWVLGLVAATGVAVAATPSAAFTYVQFAFLADNTPVHGTYVLDCPPGTGPCSLVGLTGMFGASPIHLAPAGPDYPVAAPPPDNLLTRPDYTPTGDGFWLDPVVGPDDWRIWAEIAEHERARVRLERYVRDQERYVQLYNVTGYETSVPEPATWTAMLIGFLGLGGTLRRRRRLAAAG